MAAPAKKKATRVSPTAAPRVVSAAGEPIGRFAEVLRRTREAGLAIDEFDVAENLTLYPPTEARMKALERYSAAYLLAQSSVVSLIRTQGDPPEDLDERITWAQKENEALTAAYAQADAAEQAFNEALFGGAEVYQQVQEFFADRPDWEKKAFETAVNEQFRRLPVDGKCQACGQSVDDAAGESEGESSGGSSTSGQSSRETSPTSSTESTPETGSEDSGHGTSSSPTPSESPE
jgi:hypothetical protein